MSGGLLPKQTSVGGKTSRSNSIRQVELLKEKKRRLFRTSLYAFTKHLLGRHLLMPRVHGPICEKLQDIYYGVDVPKYAVGSIRRVLILMPRGHFKSTITTESFPAWILTQNDPPSMLPEIGIPWNPPCSFNGKAGYDQRIMIANEVEDNAKQFLATVKHHLTSDVMRELYGPLGGTNRRNEKTRWNSEAANIDWRQTVTKEPNLAICSLDSAKNSNHFDIGIYDDLVSKKQVSTREQINQTINFYKEQIPLLDKPAVMIVIGTRWHDRDLYGHFLESDSEKGKWEVMIERAERSEEEIAAGKSKIFFPKAIEKDGTERVMFSKSVLADMKTTMGPYFYHAQMNNECVDQEAALFKKEYFEYTGFFYEMPAGDSLKRWLASMTVIQTADPAISEDKKACKAVVCTWAWDHRGHGYLLDLFAKQGVNPGEFLDEYFRQYRIWRAVQCGIELVGFQRVLKFNADQKSLKENLFPPFVELKPDGRNKDRRILGLEPLFRNRRIHILAEHEALIDEAKRYPRGVSKDILDATAYQIDLAFAGQMPLESGKEFNQNEIVIADEALGRDYEEHVARLCGGRRIGRDWYYN